MHDNWQHRCPAIEAALNHFPDRLHSQLKQISGGVIPTDLVRQLCNDLGTDIENLMLKLVPLAAAFAVAPVSGFSVGAVVRGQRQDASGYSALYLGANMEFPQHALCYSLHAEQSAVANAWSNRENGITSLAVSAPPCGHCRQFLYELCGSRSLRIIFPEDVENNYREMDISELLPGAFGPVDLGREGNMMAVNAAPLALQLEAAESDMLVQKALDAARFSYAPYTSNLAGCAVLLQDGSVFSGSYAENAAHNPGLSPLHAVLSNLRMEFGPAAAQHIPHKLSRCVLVESGADISQRALVTTLLSSIAPGTALEYYPARIATS